MSKPLEDNDPCLWMLYDNFTTKPVVYKKGCYICEDPEFAQMGLPLCYKCKFCGGHVAADDSTCSDCGKDNIDGAENCEMRGNPERVETTDEVR